MKGKTMWMVIATLVVASAVPVEGQAPSRRGGVAPMSVDRAAARALQLADELELSEEQRDDLHEVRAGALAALETLERERLDLRQELRARRRQQEVAGEGSAAEMRGLRDEQRSRMEALRDRERELTAPLMERYESVLGAEQRLQLQEMQRDRRARAWRGSDVRRRMDRGRSEFRNRREGRDGRGGRGGWDGRAERRWRTG